MDTSTAASKSLMAYATGISPDRLNRVWAEAQEANAAAVARGRPAPCLGNEIHCALIQAGFKSICWYFPPQVIGALVDKGVWSIEQAYEAGRRYPWGALDGKWTLREVAQRMPDAMRTDALQVALAHIPQAYADWVRAIIITDLAPFLPESLLKEALRLATTLDNEYDQAESIAGLAPYLTPQLLQETEAIICGFERETSQARASLGLLPHFVKTNQEKRVRDVIALTLHSEDKGVMSELVPMLLEAGYKEEALSVIRAIGYYETRIKTVRAALPHLTPAEQARLVAETLTYARSVQKLEDRVAALVELLPHLPDEKKAEVVTEALDVAEKIQDTDKWVKAVSLVAVHLSPRERNQLARRAFKVAQAMQNPYSRAFALQNVAPILPGASLRRLLKSLESVKTEYQEDIIKAIAPTLSEKMFAKAWAASLNLYTASEATRCLNALAAHWPESSILELLKTVQALPDKDRREIVLGRLASRLAKLGYADEAVAAAQTAGILMQDYHLAEMVPHLPAPALDKLVAGRQAVQDTYRQIEAIGALIPHLSPRIRSAPAQTALSWVPDIQGDHRRVHAWAALLPHLPEYKRKQVYKQARAQAVGHVSRAKLAVFDPEFDLEKAIRQAYSWTDTEEVQALTELVERVPPTHPGREALIQKALDRAHKVSISYRAAALGYLLPYLTGKAHTHALETALQLAEVERWPWHPDDLTQAELEEMLLFVCNLKTKWLRMNGFAALIPRLTSLPLDRLYSLWQKALSILAKRKREYLLADLCALLPIITLLGGSGVVGDIIRAIQILTTSSRPGQWPLPRDCC